MKQRTITGLAIAAVLILVMFARQLSSYIFDAFVLALTILASYEMSNLLTKQGLYNNKYFAMMYPLIAYALYMIGILCKLKIYIVVVMQIGLIVILVGALALINLFATKATKNEIATRKLKLKVPAGTQSGKFLRLRDEGVPVIGSTRKGDLYIKIIVQIPSKLSSKEKDILEEFAKLENPTDSPQPISISSFEQM